MLVSSLTAGGMQLGCPGLIQQTALLMKLNRQLKTQQAASPKLRQPAKKAFVTLPPSKTRKLKQYASFMHLKKQRKSELKTDWCLCLHVSA